MEVQLLLILNKMWFKRKVAEPKTETPKPTIREVVMEIVMVNNKTEKEYIIKSENDFGIDWRTIDGWLHIWQLNSLDGDGKALAAVIDFSIVKCNWQCRLPQTPISALNFIAAFCKPYVI